MILWTIQPLTVWRLLEQTGHLRPNLDFVEKDQLFSYQWMVDQMERRLSARPQPDSMPVWAWYQYHGQSRQRPDLRCGAHLAPATQGVRIEFEIDAGEALLSDFDLWHFVLNCWYLPRSLADEQSFERELRRKGTELGGAPVYRVRELLETDLELQRRLSRSWERIFDIYWTHPEYAAPFWKKSVQACLWVLSLNQVRRVWFFRAR